MRCAEVRESLVAYLDSELSPEEREKIASHLAGCAACRGEREALGSTADLLGCYRVPGTTSEDLAGRVLRQAQAEKPWCRHIQRELVAHLDGELGDIEARPVREHIEECEECRALCRGLLRTGDALSRWVVEPFCADLTEKLLGPEGRRRRRPRRRLLPMAAAAMVLAALGIGAFVGLSGPGNGSSRDLPPPLEVLRNLDLLEARTLDLLDEDPDLLELADRLDWLESVSEEDLAMLSAQGG